MVRRVLLLDFAPFTSLIFSLGMFYLVQRLPHTHQDCSISNVVYLLAGLGGLVVILVAGIILLKFGKRQRLESQRLQREQETTKLIPKPLPGPVYSGD